jgi:hypothetical protein
MRRCIDEPGSGLALDTESASTLVLDLLTLKTVSNKFLFISHSIYGILLQQSKWTETVCFSFPFLSWKGFAYAISSFLLVALISTH